jgi:transcriptional regulator with XRE-family HTH domain
VLFAFFVKILHDYGMENIKTNRGGLPQNAAGAETGAGSRKPDAKRKPRHVPGIDNTQLDQAAEKRAAEIRKMFGKNLARFRKQAGYSQLALSLETGLTHNFINELEQGGKGASFQTLSKLSVVLRTPIAQFFEPEEGQPALDSCGFQYPDPINQIVDLLHETIDTWNTKRTK